MGFGQLGVNLSFTQEAAFETIAFHIIQSCFLDPPATANILAAHLLLHPPHDTTHHLADYDFSWIQTPNPDWTSQSNINSDKPDAFLSCLFHFKMDVDLMMQYLGGSYMAAHHDV